VVRYIIRYKSGRTLDLSDNDSETFKDVIDSMGGTNIGNYVVILSAGVLINMREVEEIREVK
jgi:hypothetical protein